MLQENKELLNSLHNKATTEQTLEFKSKINQINGAKNKYVKYQIKKYTLITLCSLCVFFILFYPVQSGNIIGQWIHDFFGTIYKINK